MERKTALVVIYNHRYDKNIPRVEHLYKGRFQNIFHVVPFYDGTATNVIPVYENSIYFSGYVAQAYTHLRAEGFTHFFFVADDMILNPEINESNYLQLMNLDEDSCYIDQLYDLQSEKEWCHLEDAIRWTPQKRGVEIGNALPMEAEARRRFEIHNLSTGEISGWNRFLASDRRSPKRIFKLHRLAYPLVGGYSDIFIVTAKAMDRFATYCGAFAATDLFVEIAIPTAIALAADKLRTIADTPYRPGSLWTPKDLLMLKGYDHSLSKLLANFPGEYLYLHPVKLSQWQD